MAETLVKKCCCCKKYKFFKEFNKLKSSKDGFSYECKKCKNKKSRELYEKRKKINDNKKLKTVAEKYVKECHVCQHWKFLADFRIDRKTKDGYGYICKYCYAKRSNVYYHNNKETILIREKNRREKNKEKERSRCKKYYYKNKQKEYIRLIRKRLYKRCYEYKDIIYSMSDNKLIYESNYIWDKMCKCKIEKDNLEYRKKLIQQVSTKMMIECENRCLEVTYNWNGIV